MQSAIPLRLVYIITHTVLPNQVYSTCQLHHEGKEENDSL